MNKSTFTNAREHLLNTNTRIDIKPIAPPERQTYSRDSRENFIQRDQGDYGTARSGMYTPSLRQHGPPKIIPYVNDYEIPTTNPNNFYGKRVSSSLLPFIDGSSMDRSKLDGTNVDTKGMGLSSIRGASNDAFHQQEMDRREEIINGHKDFLNKRRGVGLLDSVNMR